MESWKAEGPRTKTLTRQIKKTIVKVPTNSCIYAVLRERLKQHGHFSILYKIQLCSIHLCFKYQQLNPLFPFVDIFPLCCQQASLCFADFHCNKTTNLKHHGYMGYGYHSILYVSCWDMVIIPYYMYRAGIWLSLHITCIMLGHGYLFVLHV